MTDIATVAPLRPGQPSAAGVDILASRASFEHMQRVAKVFCASDLIPAHLKKNNGADALLAMQIAKRMNEDPVSVMQNIYFVSGKAGWSASYMIARANRSGVFKGPIRWKTEGQGDDMKVTARGRLAEIEGEDVDVTVSMKMAIAEGWTKNPKYKTMGEHMLRWRSATMLIRLYCPEVMMGMATADELADERFAGTLHDITERGEATTAGQVNAMLSVNQPDSPAASVIGDVDPMTGEIQQPAEPDKPGEEVDPWYAIGTGQEGITASILALIDGARTADDLDRIDAANSARVAKFTQGNRSKITAAMDDKKEDLGAA